jgi:hypothetical protein
MICQIDESGSVRDSAWLFWLAPAVTAPDHKLADCAHHLRRYLHLHLHAIANLERSNCTTSYTMRDTVPLPHLPGPPNVANSHACFGSAEASNNDAHPLPSRVRRQATKHVGRKTTIAGRARLPAARDALVDRQYVTARLSLCGRDRL